MVQGSVLGVVLALTALFFCFSAKGWRTVCVCGGVWAVMVVVCVWCACMCVGGWVWWWEEGVACVVMDAA